MGRMIRQKREYICSFCAEKYIKWQGICRKCKKAGTLQEKTLITQKPRGTLSQKALGERAKRSERAATRRTTAVDGFDPAYKNIVTSTGRVGHITALQIDGISRSYVIENKNRVMPTWLIKAWIQINQRAVDFNKDAFLHIDPPNMPKTFIINGKQVPLSTLAVIAQDRHEHLIKRERVLSEVENLLLNDEGKSATNVLADIQEILRNQ